MKISELWSAGAEEPLRRRRVVFLFGHMAKGGMQKVASDLSMGLPKRFELAVAYFGSDDPGFPYLAELVDLGCPGRTPLGRGRRVLNSLRRWLRLQLFVLRWRADDVVSFGEVANVMNALTWGKRTVLSVHAPIDDELAESGWYGRVYRGAAHTFYRRADVIVTVSRGIADSLVRQFGIPERLVKVIHNGCNPVKIRQLAQMPVDAGIADVLASPTVISVGSLEHVRGHDLSLRAFALARQKVPALQFLVVGDGSLRRQLESLAADLGLGGAVHFLGHVANPYKYLSRATIFVSAARYEGFGLALLEAMACGIPVVATDCRFGPREILGDPQAGILVSAPASCEASVVEKDLSRAIVALATSSLLREKYAQRGVARSEEFGIEAQLSAWCEVL